MTGVRGPRLRPPEGPYRNVPRARNTRSISSPQVKVEVVCSDGSLQLVIDTILKTAQPADGDGKIFVNDLRDRGIAPAKRAKRPIAEFRCRQARRSASRGVLTATREAAGHGREKLYQQHESGSPGVQVCACLTELLDAVLLELYQAPRLAKRRAKFRRRSGGVRSWRTVAMAVRRWPP